MPVRTVPGAAVLDLFHGEAEEEHVFLACFLRISMVAPSRVPTVKAPFIMNFILLVPLAS